MDLDLVGRRMAEAMRVAGGANSLYTVGNSATTLYAASGGADDWAKAHLKIKYTYTVELRDKGQNGFVLPARYIKPTAEEALAAVVLLTQTVKTTEA
jgi:carboxypeptidase A4